MLIWVLRIHRTGIPRIQISRGIVGRKEDQCLEKFLDLALIILTQFHVGTLRALSLAGMASGNRVQINTPTIMAVGRSRANTPEWFRDEVIHVTAIVIPLVEGRS